MVAASLLLAVTAVFTPPRLISGDPPGLPPPTVVAEGEVLVEAIIDKTGAVSRAILLRTTPPYGQMLLDAVSRWRFAPAHDVDEQGVDTIVEAAVLIAAVYRAPVMFAGPAIGTAPQDLVRPSLAPYPISMPALAYPARAVTGGVVMLEVALDESGVATGTKVVRSSAGFDTTALDAVRLWHFRGGTRLSRPVPSTAYVVLGFPTPVLPDTSK